MRYLQQAHYEQVYTTVQGPLLCWLPLPSMLTARELRIDAALWLLPHTAHVRAQSRIGDGCTGHDTQFRLAPKAILNKDACNIHVTLHAHAYWAVACTAA